MTLTQASRTFRIGVKISGLILVVLIAIRSSVFIYSLLFPEAPPPPETLPATTAFGKLPPIDMPLAAVQFAPNYSTRLDLLTANLPTVPEVANVYEVIKAPYGFLSEDRSKELAAVFNLFDDPIELNAVENAWYAPNQTLNVNTQNLNFHYQYKYDLDTSVFITGAFTSQDSIISFANDLRSRYNIYGEFADDLSEGQPKVHLLKYLNKKLQPVTSIADASAVRVDFIRNEIPYSIGGQDLSIPFVSPNYVGSVAYMLLGSTTDQKAYRVLEVQHYLWRYNKDTAATYPILPSYLAWESVQQDPGIFTVYIGNLALGPMDRSTSTPIVQKLTIKRVLFAYYNFKEEQDFIQPVWVFVGKATLSAGGELDWVGYVPAVSPEWIEVE